MVKEALYTKIALVQVVNVIFQSFLRCKVPFNWDLCILSPIQNEYTKNKIDESQNKKLNWIILRVITRV